jgi:dynein heavy chain, axonemal
VSNDTLVSIFKSILSWHMSLGNGFPAPVSALVPSIVAATLQLYSLSIAKLLPTPSKSHYVFNLRCGACCVCAGQ